MNSLVPTQEVSPKEGLSQEQVQQRLDSGKSNLVTFQKDRSEKEIILHHLLTFFNLVFVVLALILAICGSSVKNMTFLVIALANSVIGCFQEIRAKRAVDKLTLVAAQTLKTIRNGKTEMVRSDLLVQDDIVEFAAGNQICADGIVRTGFLQVDESLITGEADAIAKNPGDELKSGSFVIAGTARAQLTHVGNDAFAAKLAEEAKSKPRAAKSEMMRSLDKLIKFMGIMLIPVGILLFCHQFFRLSSGLLISAESTVAALVGMIPEGLYLLTSIALAVSAIKLTQQRVLVQDMNCIETLARVDVLCVDKTGTITEPVMQVENVIPLSGHDPEHLEKVLAAMYGTREPDNDTAKAMYEMFKGDTDWQCTRYVPFTSQNKWTGSEFKGQGSFLVGAPEFIMGERFTEVEELATHWASTGYRVLLVAEYDSHIPDRSLNPKRVTPLALVLITSRIREKAPKTFAYFEKQGVTIKVISGDNPATVADVARRAGIRDADKYIDAGELETEQDFLDAVDAYTVFGRVTPDKKKSLIQALKAKKHTVAMTGDGVNDVLAMKQADCGIAMASGAQAASQVAQLVLLDSDFGVIPDIVGEGRRVINNIQRAATLFLVKNIMSLGLSLLTMFTGLSYPFVPLNLSLIAVLTIGVPGFFLALEPNYSRVTGRFLPTVLRRAFPGGIANILLVMIAILFMQNFGFPVEDLRTVCTAVLSVVGLLVLFKVCQPMSLFRGIVLGAMAVGLVASFLFLGDFLYLSITDNRSLLVILAVGLAAPTVFFVLLKLFTLWDKLWAKLKAIPAVGKLYNKIFYRK